MNRVYSLPFRFPGVPGVQCLFTTRVARTSGGEAVSADLSRSHPGDEGIAEANIFRLQEEHGFRVWRELSQAHGTRMVFLESLPEDRFPPQADAQATSLAGQAMAIKVADCQPVLLAHASGGYVAALHVGWRANRASAPGRWVREFCEHYGLEPRLVHAVRGPSLSPAASEFTNFHREWGRDFLHYFHPGRQTVNLWHLTRDQLTAAGIPQDQIYGLDLCTYTQQELFYSHRRDGDPRRQAGIIWIE